ncbi:MAG: TolC family protein [Saprospiraceae bacterium]
MLRFFLFAITLIVGQAVVAQTLTLQQAVTAAIGNSLAVEQGELEMKGDEINLYQAKMAQYPSLSAGTNLGYQFGLGVDPTTNNLVQQSISFNSYNVNAGVTLYQGGRIKNTIAQNKQQLASSMANIEATKQDISLQVAQSYLEAILAKEQVGAAKSQLASGQQQLDRLTRLIAAGSAAPADRFELEANVARQEQTLTQGENAVALTLLKLRQILRLPAGQEIDVISPESIDFAAIQLPVTTAEALYQSAITKQASVRAAQLAEEAAVTGIDVAKSNYYPTLSAFGQMDTRYSSSVQDIDKFDLISVEQPVTINGQNVLLGTAQATNFTFVNRPFGTQLQDFFGQNVGLSLQVPILNNGRAKSAVERAKLALLQSQLATQQEKQTIELNVQQALQNATAAKSDVDASERAFQAAEAAYDAAQKRNELGAGSTFDLTNAQILLEQAQITLIRARYQYLFNVKVVDFYLGRPLQLD